MRQIILDTETTGLETRQGHRIIEVAALEMQNRRLTGNYFHQYINPDREIDEGAMQVHGIRNEFLQDKPRFADVAGDFVEYIRGAELIIHNAPFDTGFLNAEFSLLNLPRLDSMVTGVVDTLAMARSLHPGQRNNLDALCKRYGVDNASRTLHGALIDCELLAQVYLSMTRGQDSLIMEVETASAVTGLQNKPRSRARPIKVHATEEEQALHARLLEVIKRESGGNCLWRVSET